MAAEPGYTPPPPSGRITDSIADIVDDVQRLVELEIELVQQELKELAIRNGIALGLIAVGALGVLFVLIFLQVALVTALPTPAWLNALVLALFWVIAAAILFYVGRMRIKIAPPEKTIQSIKEDVEWVKQQIRLVQR